jgi:hypothetical protein
MARSGWIPDCPVSVSLALIADMAETPDIRLQLPLLQVDAVARYRRIEITTEVDCCRNSSWVKFKSPSLDEPKDFGEIPLGERVFVDPKSAFANVTETKPHHCEGIKEEYYLCEDRIKTESFLRNRVFG